MCALPIKYAALMNFIMALCFSSRSGKLCDISPPGVNMAIRVLPDTSYLKYNCNLTKAASRAANNPDEPYKGRGKVLQFPEQTSARNIAKALLAEVGVNIYQEYGCVKRKKNTTCVIGRSDKEKKQ
ncbi:unnamed protein product [Cylicocyclus nassatus]|uniref:Uncharacterized protein n=1 Tax=Cylicocyclus nassatus TaxID=53992 RepID=A0AA36GUG9_CYLNA|nr:unnamed protein product [Cylicocyclus nassatus]